MTDERKRLQILRMPLPGTSEVSPTVQTQTAKPLRQLG